jgi:methionyl-tRNA formyltransferase
MKAVVFAYHNVGARCLPILLAHGVEVPLVVTHRDNPTENIWFDSVAEIAAKHGIATITPDDPNIEAIIARVRALNPDFLFSFYYRNMLKPPLLAIPKRGALNMHGSLLPKYRGRAPVNWAVINGEIETGATLHYMVEKPDAGDLVSQQAVPILPDDTALEVFHKVTAAAVQVLDRNLPGLIADAAPRIPQDLSKGSYFGARRPEDGCINWSWPATRIHNLVRGVAPPYPGAFCTLNGKTLRVLKTRLNARTSAGSETSMLYCDNDRYYARCGDGQALELLQLELDGVPLTPSTWKRELGSTTYNLI